jgi:hypothetical protein
LSKTHVFPNCEAVACAKLGSGIYNIGGLGEPAFCENAFEGGGWLRLLRMNETVCESLGEFTSAANDGVEGREEGELGCRATTRCSVAVLASPFPFSEVRGLGWKIFVFGTPDGFHGFLDGVFVHDGTGRRFFAFTAGPSDKVDCGRCLAENYDCTVVSGNGEF